MPTAEVVSIVVRVRGRIWLLCCVRFTRKSDCVREIEREIEFETDRASAS